MTICQHCGLETGIGTRCDHCFSALSDPAVVPGMRIYPITGIGIAAIGAIVLSLLVDLGSSLTSLVSMDLARDGELERAYSLSVASAVIATIPMVLVGVLVIIWLWRARKNLDAFPGAAGGLGAGWAIGAWWIPLANTVLTGKIVHNVARESLTRRWSGQVAIAWCLAFWISQLMHRFGPDAPSGLFVTNDDHVAFFKQSLAFDLTSTALLTIAGGCLSVLLITVSKAQHARAERANGRVGL